MATAYGNFFNALGKPISVLLLCIGTLACSGTPSPPPSGPPSGSHDPAFCALAGQDLMQALDGTWKLQQGAGVALGGGFTIPLPPHPPKTAALKYDPQRGLLDIQAADQSDGMVMFPAANKQQAQAKELLETQKNLTKNLNKARKKKKDKKAETSGSGCDSNAVPIMIGTQGYVLERFGTDRQNLYGFLQYGNDPICDRYNSWLEHCPRCEIHTSGGLKNEPNTIKSIESYCQLRKISDGDLKMTLVLQFTSPRYATGTVYFKGQNTSKVTVKKGWVGSLLFGRDTSFDMKSVGQAMAPITLFR